MPYKISGKGYFRQPGDELIPKDILNKIPKKRPIDINKCPVFGKITYDNTNYYILARNGDSLVAFKTEFSKPQGIVKISLKNFENKDKTSDVTFPPYFSSPDEFTAGENIPFNINADKIRKNLKMYHVLNKMIV